MHTSTFKGTRPAALYGEKYVQSYGRQVDWDVVPNSFRIGAVKVTAGANAAQNATTMTLNVPVGTKLSKGYILDFGGKFARLAQSVTGTGANVAGILVDALVTAIALNDVATVPGRGSKFIPAMTIMQQLSSGKVIPMTLNTKVYSGVAAAKGTNTGNGTISAITVTASVQPGAYKIVFIEPASNLGTFTVEDPLGATIGEGVVGAAFSNQIGFTISDGSTDFIAGDEFSITITQTDGSTCAGCIITDASEDSVTDSLTGYGMVVSGVVFENLMPDAVAGVLTAAQKAALQACGQGFVFETYADTRGN